MERPEALIERLPDCLHWSPDGEIRVVGHRIGLYHLIYYYNEGYNAEMLLEQYPTLELELIHKSSISMRETGNSLMNMLRSIKPISRFRASYVPGPGVLRIRELMRQRAHSGEPS